MSTQPENVRLTKAGLLEAIKDYPDDAPVVIARLGIPCLSVSGGPIIGYMP